MTRQAGALLLINDNVELALRIEADGVHLGPEDMTVEDARCKTGRGLLIGASCGTIAEAMAASVAGADYIGVGPVFGTATKVDAGPAIGLQALAAIAAATPLPVAAIGGIDGAAIASVLRAGAVMACVVSAVAAAGDEAAMTQAVRTLLNSCQG
jgi:thiamine-phosphate diphosphorylase